MEFIFTAAEKKLLPYGYWIDKTIFSPKIYILFNSVFILLSLNLVYNENLTFVSKLTFERAQIKIQNS